MSETLFFFLLFPLLPLLSSLAHAKVCPDCGSTPVPYPLSTVEGCGDPSYKIRCDNSTGSLFFDALNGASYAITSITPSTQRLAIRPADFFSPSTCTTTDLPYRGLQLNNSLPFNVTSSNTIMLFNCSRRILFSPLNCSAISPCHAYINAHPDAAGCRSPRMICCSFVAGGSSTSYGIRASSSGCSAYRSFVNINTVATPVSQWGQGAGIELQWMLPKEPACRSQADCEPGCDATCGADPEAGGDGLRRCFCNSGLRWDPISGTCANNGTVDAISFGPLIAGFASGLCVVLQLCVAGFMLYQLHRRIRTAREQLLKKRVEILNANNSSGRTVKNFTSMEIKRATNHFSHNNLLGSGGFGVVYKGVLEDGTLVAAKCAKMGNAKSAEQVLNEVRILSHVNHRSLVRLLGCCVEMEQPVMVYEFIPSGTLFDHLHGRRSETVPLSWRRRLAIAHQTAEGLAYLHLSAVPPIYHRDVKSSNILLDEKLHAKVSDFGLSRLAENDLSHISTCAQGTFGYLDPEYYRNYQLTDKSDVYSFGVVLLELLTSQKVIDLTREVDDVSLVMYVHRKAAEGKLMEVVDEEVKNGASQVELDTMEAVGLLAIACLEERRQNRPSMKDVAEEIQYIMTVELRGVQTPSVLSLG